MPDPSRAILHLDLDAFYAAVEVLENKELKGQRLIIGGRGRGVVTTASYEARRFGVHSAMPMFQALQKCPNAVVLPPRVRLYRVYSRQVMAILREYTPLMEQVSIDEAYLDLTERVDRWEQARDIAAEIQARIESEIRPLDAEDGSEQEYVPLTASIGVATNKLVAKVASDWKKPRGLTVVRPGQEAAFLAPLPVRVIWGVGPVTAETLGKMGIKAVGELARVSDERLEQQFGRHGPALARRALGIDRRAVVTDRQTKSVSHETTFRRDLADLTRLEKRLEQLSKRVAARLQRYELTAATIAIKLRYADFTTLSRQMTLAVPTDDPKVISPAANVLLRRTWEPGRPVRLLGVAGRHLSSGAGQLALALDQVTP